MEVVIRWCALVLKENEKPGLSPGFCVYGGKVVAKKLFDLLNNYSYSTALYFQRL